MLDVRNPGNTARTVSLFSRKLVANLRVESHLRINDPCEDYSRLIKPAAGTSAQEIFARGGRDFQEGRNSSKPDGSARVKRGHVPHLKIADSRRVFETLVILVENAVHKRNG